MALKGLVIRQPWIGMILRGDKTWEMRNKPCRHRGRIALIEKGTGTIVALARIVDDLPALSETEMRSTIDKHRIPEDEIIGAVQRGWTRPWVLTDVVQLSAPVPYEHTSGGSWVNLTPSEEAAVLATRGYRDAAPEASYSDEMSNRLAPFLASNSQWDDGGWTSKRPSRADNRKFKASAQSLEQPSVDKLSLEIIWGDGRRPDHARHSLRWLEPLGIFALLIMYICQLGFVVHLVLGIITDAFSFFSAFKWLVPMFVAMLVALLTGQGHLLVEEK